MPGTPKKSIAENSEMRELIREKNWSQTSLGSPDKWPQRLKATIDLIVGSGFPMIVRWGKELIQIYNDAYRVILQDKHPEGLGQSTKECWPAGWEFNKPIFERIFNGETVTLEDQLFTVDRGEPNEDVRFTVCHSPIRDESGDVAGVLSVVFETTDRLKFEKRREQYEKELHEREERKSFMLQFEDNIRGLEDSRAVMQKAAESIGKKLDADRAGYGEMDESGEYLIIKTDWTSEKVPSLKGRLRIADFGPKMIEELSAGNLISFNDHLNSVFTEGVVSNYEEINNRACIKAPLMRGDELRALFFVHQSESREWTDENKKLVQEMADRTWHAVERARAEEALRKNREQLSEDLIHMRKLHKLFRKLANELNLNTALQKILSAACEFSDTGRGTIQVVSGEGERDEIAACQGYKENSKFVKYFLKKGCDLACDVARSECKRVITDNIRTSPDFQGTKDRKVALDNGILAQQSTPMITREGKVVGVLSTQFDKPYRPSDRELRFIDLLAWTAAEFVERDKTEEAVREREEYLRLATDAARMGTWVLDLRTEESPVHSPQHDKIFGYDEPLKNWSFDIFIEHIYPDDRDLVEQRFEEAFETGAWAFECRIKRADDKLRWITAQGDFYYNDEGEPVRAVGIVQDITDRKEAEEELQKSEERQRFLVELNDTLQPLSDSDNILNETYRLLAEQLNVDRAYFVEVDEEAGIATVEEDYSNGKVPSLKGEHPVADFGWSVEILRRGDYYAISDTQSSNLVPEAGRTASDALQIIACIGVPLIKEGHLVGALCVTNSREREWAEREVNLLGEVAERTWSAIERAKAEEELEESEHRYRNLFESMDEGYCIIEMIFDENDEPVDYRFLEMNPAFEEQTGLKDAEGERMLDLAPNHEKHWFEIYGKVAKAGEPVRFEQKAEHLPNPSIYDVYAFRFGQPEERKVAILFNDITQIKETQQELRELNETLEDRVERRTEELMAYQEQLRKLANKLSVMEEEQRRYLATELHDNLGQLLAVIKMNLDMVKRDDLPEKVVKQLRGVDETVHKSISYTRQLMSELKPPPGLKEAKFEDTLYWIQNKMEQHGLKVLIEDGVKTKPLPEESRIILQQSIRELLYNVVKYAEVNEAYINLANMNGKLKIDVKDKGKGFKIEEKELKPTTEGGFGLFNIKERLEMIGGAFKIISKPGKGTTATLLAPLKGAQETTGQETTGQETTGQETTGTGQEATDGQPTKKLIKILLVDDHQLVREGLRSLIDREEDMTVVAEAKNGVEAIDLAGKVEPDIIVMDVNMPKMDGIEATQKIMKGDGQLRVVGLSIHDREKGGEAIRQAGASVYLTKDEATETLCATIRSEYETLQ